MNKYLLGGVAALFAATILPTSAERLPGPSFTDPADQVETMPDGWAEQPIVRKEWAEGADIAVTLDQHLYPALLPIIQRFASENELAVAVQEGTCGISAGQLETKNADIGGFCCPPGAGDRLPGLRYHTLGIASLAVLVHPENKVRDLSEPEIRQIFAGDTAFWNELPGSDYDALVHPVARLHCKARPGHWRLILDRDEDFSPRLDEVSTIPDMIAGVAQNRDAIGYEVLWMTRQFESMGEVATVDINGVSPWDEEALVAGRYPFYRTYNISSWEDAARSGEADRLVQYIKDNLDQMEPRYGLIPVDRLRAAGWRFHHDELIGTPPASDQTPGDSG